MFFCCTSMNLIDVGFIFIKVWTSVCGVHEGASGSCGAALPSHLLLNMHQGKPWCRTDFLSQLQAAVTKWLSATCLWRYQVRCFKYFMYHLTPVKSHILLWIQDQLQNSQRRARRVRLLKWCKLLWTLFLAFTNCTTVVIKCTGAFFALYSA